jgi:hypothetical protein
MLELVYGQPMEADARFAQRTAQTQQAVKDQLAQLPKLDLEAVAPYQTIYSNPSLGLVTLTLKGQKLMLEADTFSTELRSAGNGTYLFWDPPLVSMQVKLNRDSAGHPVLELVSEDPDQPGRYSFTQVR